VRLFNTAVTLIMKLPPLRDRMRHGGLFQYYLLVLTTATLWTLVLINLSCPRAFVL